MAKRKYPSELNSRTIRVNISDWHWLLEISRQAGVTVAEAFHMVLQQQKAATKVPPAQFSFRVPPVEAATAVNGHRQVAMVANGHTQVARVVKQKGGIRHD